MEIKLKPFQDEFLFSPKKFPCLCAGVGTGKTLMLLLKAWNHAQEYPGSVGLIVRKEFTDLHDSTIKDFHRYFNININSNKEYHFPNGSVLMLLKIHKSRPLVYPLAEPPDREGEDRPAERPAPGTAATG